MATGHVVRNNNRSPQRYKEIPRHLREQAIRKLEVLLARVPPTPSECYTVLHNLFNEADAGPTIDNESCLDELGINSLYVNCLNRAGIRTVGQLCQHTRTELMRVKRIKENAIFEIESALKNHNLQLNPVDVE